MIISFNLINFLIKNNNFSVFSSPINHFIDNFAESWAAFCRCISKSIALPCIF